MSCVDSHMESLCMSLQKTPGKALVMEIAAEAVGDAAVLEALLQLMSDGDDSLRRHAAWAVEQVSRLSPRLLEGRYREVAELAMASGVPEGFRRLLLGILYNLPDEDSLNVALFNFLLDKMVDPHSSSGVQALAMKLAARMSRAVDGLHEEFLCILRNMEPQYYSTGVRSVMRNCLKR